MTDRRRLMASEFAATAFLLMAVVGSGIAAERLCGGNVGLALLVNAAVTGCALVPLIVSFAPISGAHMNPVVTLAAAASSHLPWKLTPCYIAAQCAGAIAGVWLAHVMFGLDVLQTGQHGRAGAGQWAGEVIATVGLLGTVLRCRTQGLPTTAAAVGTYIMGAYWFTSSTSFANPAVTLARSFTDTFSGIKPSDAPAFIAAQLVGLVIVVVAARLVRAQPSQAP